MKFSSYMRGLSLVWVLMMIVGLGFREVESSPCTSTFFSALVQLIPCRAAVAPFSSIPPSDACCNALRTLGQPCLCVLVTGPPISGVDRNMASQLPDKCTTNFEPCNVKSCHKMKLEIRRECY
ncbi:hypothetical protein VNO80_26542 [Phaseolus coccineus]|uniref:Bifunctional inhibitor/plant lipid transfer protein/seed storage helical domain-containing protein n=1 Tax=Phaseolus coccineus TaxID=3886 RepID=A0AAN9LIE5_PHACN